MSRDSFFTIKVRSVDSVTTLIITTYAPDDYGRWMPVETMETTFNLPFLQAWPKVSSLLNDMARENIFIPANNEVH